MRFMPRVAKQQFVRFLIMGGLSTAVMYLIYLVLCVFINYQLAYFFSYCVGIFLSYYLNVTFVFDKKISMQTFLRYPLVYVAQYCVGAAFLVLFVEKFGLSKNIAPLVIIVLTVPLTFVLSRYVMSRYS